MLSKLSTQLIIAALVGCLSAYLTALLFRKWITEDAARERDGINSHAQNLKTGIDLYVEAQGLHRKQTGG